MFEYSITVLKNRVSEIKDAQKMMKYRYNMETCGINPQFLQELVEFENKVRDILDAISVLESISSEECDNDEKIVLSDNETKDICSFEMEEEAYE